MSSLTISPKEQIQFLLRFVAHKLPVSEAAYDMAYAIPQYRGSREGWAVHGKSGSGWLRDNNGKINESRPQGWFVGWAEKRTASCFRPVEIGKEKSDIPGGSKAREDILVELPVLMGNK
ncbi:oxacillinase-carbenicillinase [Klebsiella pneumoniae]|nr:oxacillinase-carbenicillinase [Klebsiella pneumoniae]